MAIYVFVYGLKFSGTLDISVVEIKNGKFDVKSVCGDAHLGLLLRYFTSWFISYIT